MGMPGRIAIGLFAALRAVLVYGEAGDLGRRPLELPAWFSLRRPAAGARLAWSRRTAAAQRGAVAR